MEDRQHGDYLISADSARLDVITIHRWLSDTYWSKGISFSVVEAALRHSVCVGCYTAEGRQAGLVRIITDHATYAYLCDVYVDEAHRRHGLAKAMLKFGMELPSLQGLRSWSLRTRDAHKVYESLGFSLIDDPDRYMIRRFPNVYLENRDNAAG